MKKPNRRSVVSLMFFLLFAISALLYFVAVVFAVNGSCTLTPVNHILNCAVIFSSLLISARLSVNEADKEKGKQRMRNACRICTAIYLFTVLVLTLFDTYYGRGGLSHLEKWQTITKEELLEGINLIPLKTVLLYVKALGSRTLTLQNVIINLAGNCGVFMPFALFLPVSLPRLGRWWRFLIVMVCAVATIELLQLALLTGACDIDDLILNVSGAFLAFLALKLSFAKRLVNKLFFTDF